MWNDVSLNNAAEVNKGTICREDYKNSAKDAEKNRSTGAHKTIKKILFKKKNIEEKKQKKNLSIESFPPQ